MNVYRVRILKESAKNKEKKNGFRNEGSPFVLSSIFFQKTHFAYDSQKLICLRLMLSWRYKKRIVSVYRNVSEIDF